MPHRGRIGYLALMSTQWQANLALMNRVEIDPYISEKSIPKHRELLSEEYILSAVRNAVPSQITAIGGERYLVTLRRKKNSGFVTVIIYVHDQHWRRYVYGVHVTK